MKSELDLEKLKRLIDEGINLTDISILLKSSISTIKRRMCEMGLKSKIYSIKSETVKCRFCDVNFTSLKSENRKFCSSSCSSKYNNSLREKKEKREKNKKTRVFKEKNIGCCLNCESEILKKDGRNKAIYCDIKCLSEYQMNKKISNNIASSKTCKLYLIRTFGNKCMDCGWCQINEYSGKVPIELEHIDGNSENNNLDNLKLLCPNCHSLTSTYKALNKGNGRHQRMKRYNEGKSY
jgi:hypothetical protein